MIVAWAVRVRKQDGEAVRQECSADGTLDRRLRPSIDGDDLLIPVTTSPPGTERALFHEVQAHSPLPRHEQVGGIAIMHEQDPAGADAILASRPKTHTVLFSDGAVEGEFRTKTFTTLAGTPTTKTTISEHGRRFRIDLRNAYFSARLATERQRIRSALSAGEIICDMFCGVGPFPVTLADRAGWILACDKNPGAIHLLRENLSVNGIRNVLPMLGDAARLGTLFPAAFDRVLMNLPFTAVEFLTVADMITKPGGTIHLYALQECESDYQERIQATIPGCRITERFLRSYSATRWHAVYDIRKG